MTLTKEWLQKAITDIQAMRDEIPFGLDDDDRNTLEALKLAHQQLAAEAQEPVAWRWRQNETKPWHLTVHSDCAGEVQPLFAAPPAPVAQPVQVPDEWRMMCGEWRDETVSIHGASGLIVSGIAPNAAGIIIDAHNAYRAAILAAAPKQESE